MVRLAGKVRRPFIVLVLLIAAILFGTQAASAQAGGGGWLYVPGGQGYATWDWSSNRANLDNVHMVAWDTNCNSSGVYTYIEVTNMLGYTASGSNTNDACSGGASERWSYWRDVANIRGVRVYVCEDVTGWDDCSTQYYDNPNT